MAGFKITNFRGVRPRKSARNLDINEGVYATNCRLGSGDLEAWNGKRVIQAKCRATAPKTLYYYNNAGDPIWLEWFKDVSVARSPTEGDAEERLYYTGAPDDPIGAPNGSAKPKFTWAPTAKTGVVDTCAPKGWRYLGIPAPVSAPTVANTKQVKFKGTTEGMTATSLYVDFAYDQGKSPDEADCTPSTWIEIDVPVSMDFARYKWVSKPGTRFIVDSIVDANTITVSNEDGSGYLFKTGANYPKEVTWNRENTGACTNEAGKILYFYIPDGAKITVTGHSFRLGDVIRVTDRILGFEGNSLIFTDGQRIYNKTGSGWADNPAKRVINNVNYYSHLGAQVETLGGAGAPFVLPIKFPFKVIRDDSALADLEARSYVYTYVTSFGEESAPSPPSAIVQALDGDTINITGMAAPPSPYDAYMSGGYYYIYRTVTGTNETSFLYVDKVNAGTANYSDSKDVLALGDELLTTDWATPPTGLKGIVTLSNGSCAGFVGRTVYISEPYQPHAWPYSKRVDADIVALAPVSDATIVLTNEVPYIITGTSPQAMAVRKLDFDAPCVSAQSVAISRDTVVYASTDGLAAINSQGYSILTEPYMSKREWQLLAPETIHGVLWDQKYFCFFEGTRVVGDSYYSKRVLQNQDTRIVAGYGFAQAGLLIFDPRDPAVGMSTYRLFSNAIHYAPLTDRLYYYDSATASICEWNGNPQDASKQEYRWVSGIQKMDYPCNLGAARVVADNYPVTFTLYAEGQQKAKVVVQNSETFRLPAGYMASEFQVWLESIYQVHSVQVAETTWEISAG